MRIVHTGGNGRERTRATALAQGEHSTIVPSRSPPSGHYLVVFTKAVR